MGNIWKMMILCGNYVSVMVLEHSFYDADKGAELYS